MHGLDVDEYGNHIPPEKPIAKTAIKEWGSDELTAQAQKIIEYNNSKKEPEAPKPLTKQQQEFQAHIEKWRKYYEENTGRISRDMPRSFINEWNERRKKNDSE